MGLVSATDSGPYSRVWEGERVTPASSKARQFYNNQSRVYVWRLAMKSRFKRRWV